MKKYQILYNDQCCKACGICIGMCPKEVYTADYLGTAVVSNMENCNGCKICELHCPDFCMEVVEA